MPVRTDDAQIIRQLHHQFSTVSSSGGSSERSTSPTSTAPQTMRSNDDPSSSSNSTTDAVHSRFREPVGPVRRYFCHTCSEAFDAESLVDVVAHFARHVPFPNGNFHSACLYCHGKVHRFQLAPTTKLMDAHEELFYHDCNRWRSGLDR